MCMFLDDFQCFMNVFLMFFNVSELREKWKKIESNCWPVEQFLVDFFLFHRTKLQIQDWFYGYKFEHIYNVVLQKSALNRLSFLRWWL